MGELLKKGLAGFLFLWYNNKKAKRGYDMKYCKKILWIMLLATLLFSFVSCLYIPLEKYYDDIDTDSVTSVEIYDLRGTDQLSGFHETESPVYTLKADQMEAFWSDLANIQFSDSILLVPIPMDPSFYYDDWTVRINYSDGSYTFLSCDGYSETYDKNGERTDGNHYSCDNKEWTQFIRKYVPAEIFEKKITHG